MRAVAQPRYDVPAVARTWLQVDVELVGGRGEECRPAPGRIFIVAPRHTFAQLAEAIDAAFARWDRSHLHEFRLPDGRLVGFPNDEYAPELVWLDHDALRVARELAPGQEFDYVFDLGDDWLHRCRVLDEKVDPLVVYGAPAPEQPVAISGWGTIPDQYGRTSREE
jgi:hypothetical protein